MLLVLVQLACELSSDLEIKTKDAEESNWFAWFLVTTVLAAAVQPEIFVCLMMLWTPSECSSCVLVRLPSCMYYLATYLATVASSSYSSSS